ncbi:hypothetical protein L6452_35457 [Arctium lappa]|uniref:Uncharacterized protein n=1 Tax=Arctium lappa TaxID=4217 RepID=A0ACB8Y740_ARCLA|nr:hypothetical protein L6452_35457 [Arctium lappa]
MVDDGTTRVDTIRPNTDRIRPENNPRLKPSKTKNPQISSFQLTNPERDLHFFEQNLQKSPSKTPNSNKSTTRFPPNSTS